MQILNRNRAYTLAADEEAAELTLYGDIVETPPVDLRTGEPVPGDYITLEQFQKDLDSLHGKSALTIRLNSYGGDAGVSTTVHNRLRDLAGEGTALTCVVDGVAMSGGSLIMCACDTVKVHPSSLIMIHKCWTFLYGEYNADDLNRLAKSQEAWDRAQISIYQRKTGLSETVLSHMMRDATYMAGREAVEKGFADELLDDDIRMAASADGGTLFAAGRPIRMLPGTRLPDWLPVQEAPIQAESAHAAAGNTTPDEPGKGGNHMTLEELRAQSPELVAEIEAGARASGAAEAARTERERIAAIDEVAGLFSPDLVHEAKYGDAPMTAQELAYQAAVRASRDGRKFLNNMQADCAESGAAQVAAVPPKADSAPQTDAQKRAEAKRRIHDLLNGGANNG